MCFLKYVRRLVLVLMVILLYVSTNTSFQTTKSKIKTSVLKIKCASESKPIKAIGYFGNTKFTYGHAWGYSLDLWREQDNIYGFLVVNVGLIGDSPTGLLENVEYDSRTKRFKFSAKLSTGAIDNGKGKYIRSKELFEFEGKLLEKRVEGTFIIRDKINTTAKEQKVRVTLKFSKKYSTMRDYKSCAEWRNYATEILNFRGPSNW